MGTEDDPKTTGRPPARGRRIEDYANQLATLLCDGVTDWERLNAVEASLVEQWHRAQLTADQNGEAPAPPGPTVPGLTRHRSA